MMTISKNDLLLNWQKANVVSAFTISSILDGISDDSWEQYKKDLENAGLKSLLEVYQGAYDRFVESK